MFNIADISGCISGLDRHRRDDEVYPFFLKKNYFFWKDFLKKVGEMFGAFRNNC